jgi:hypothetical protein
MFGGSYSEFIETGTDPGKYFQPQYINPQLNIIPPNNFKPFSIDMC